MNADDQVIGALVRHLIIQAARDGELPLAEVTDIELRDSILRLMDELAEYSWEARVQSEHRPRLVHAAQRFLDEGDAELAILVYATAVEHWVNGMLEVGLRRREQQLDPATERGSLACKLSTRWPDLLGSTFPLALREPILELADARNEFVHYKWTSRSADEHDQHSANAAAIARNAPRILADLDELEDSIVFDGARAQLDRILDGMGLLDAQID